MLRNQKGFTLIELIIVIVIIGILAAVAIPKFNTLDASAKAAACEKNKMNIQQAVTSYYGQEAIENEGQGAYPTGQTDLVPDYLGATLSCPVDGQGGDDYSWETDTTQDDAGVVECNICDAAAS